MQHSDNGAKRRPTRKAGPVASIFLTGAIGALIGASTLALGISVIRNMMAKRNFLSFCNILQETLKNSAITVRDYGHGTTDNRPAARFWLGQDDLVQVTRFGWEIEVIAYAGEAQPQIEAQVGLAALKYVKRQCPSPVSYATDVINQPFKRQGFMGPVKR
jgi:hypothetical protein